MNLEGEILGAVGLEKTQLEPEETNNQVQEVVVDEPIANTIDNFGKILNEYEPA